MPKEAIGFYLVARDNGRGAPLEGTKRHEGEAEARAEAERLALANHGSRFIILRATAAAEKPPAVEWMEYLEP